MVKIWSFNSGKKKILVIFKKICNWLIVLLNWSRFIQNCFLQIKSMTKKKECFFEIHPNFCA